MHKILISAFSTFTLFSLQAQSGEALIQELYTINKTVVNKSGHARYAAAISNRAMNVFLADKTSYLSQSTDLSLYTNYVTLNTTEGQLTVNHNFQKAMGIDDPIKKLFSAGISINVANEIAAAFLDKKQDNELGIMLSYKWLGKVKTHFADGAKTGSSTNQKQSMDALRAALLQNLFTEIRKKEADFKAAIEAIDTTAVPSQNRETAMAIMLRNFSDDLKNEYREKFTTQQAALLTKTKNFRSISAGWTSFTTYIPIVSPAYTIAPSLTTAFQKKHSYPLNLLLSHTRLWENTKTGRWFLTLGGSAFFNNSKLSYGLDKVDLEAYKKLGGRDTLHLAALKNGKAYLGPYETFVTPSVMSRLVYFPPGDAHVGISIAFEQNFGKYHLLRGKLGIPVILINSKRVPALNLEFYAMFFDITNRVSSDKRYGAKNTIGVTLGMPFSRLMY